MLENNLDNHDEESDDNFEDFDDDCNEQDDHFVDLEEDFDKEQEPSENECTPDEQESDLDDFHSTAEGHGDANSSGIYRMNRALLELRCKVEDAIRGSYILGKPNKMLSAYDQAKFSEELIDITIWGVTLLPSKGHDGTDVVLCKFLKATDFKVHDAFSMLQRTLKWRKEQKIDEILGDKLGSEFDNVSFLNGRDRDGRPCLYSLYESMKDRELYKNAFGSNEKCHAFLKWMLQIVEKGIRELSFKNGEADSIVQIIDLRNAPGTKEISSDFRKSQLLFQNHYPDLIHKNIIVNVPFWYHASQLLASRIFNKRNKEKCVFARAANSTETLLEYISPENLPVEYGGLKKDKDDDFTLADKATELRIRGNAVSLIEFPINEVGLTMVWDITVVGWDVSYKEEFIPDDEGSYRILLQSNKKMSEYVKNSFYINEPGKVVLSIENWTYKKKMVFYRYKTKPTVPMYCMLTARELRRKL